MGLAQNYEYTPCVDICTIAFCIVCVFLVRSTFTYKDRSLKLFKACNFLVAIASLCGPIAHIVYKYHSGSKYLFVTILRNIKYIILCMTLIMISIYISNISRVTERQKKSLSIFSLILFLFFVGLTVSTYWTRLGFFVDKDYVIHAGQKIEFFDIFFFIYLILIMLLVRKAKRKFVPKIRRCIENVALLSTAIMILQIIFNENSFTCLLFSFPMVTFLFLFHYNSYDRKTGLLDDRSFEAYIKELGNKSYTLICLCFDKSKNFKIENIAGEFYYFNEYFFEGAISFRVNDNRFILIYEDAVNLEAVMIYPKFVEEIEKLSSVHKLDYKLLMIHSSPEFSTSEDYLSFWDYLYDKIPHNTSYEADRDDVKDFLKADYILRQLNDINQKKDLDDERVVAFCQPVLDTKTNTFTSAEALMRLTLEDIGMVYPNVFIPLAEKFDYIHTLSLIILNKVCKCVRKLMDEGYVIKRVSVNFAMSELKDSNFCEEIMQIIEKNEVPFEKIAVELTESMNEAEYANVKKIMSVLHDVGMKFYLDDFGTGYSNIERIMKLPIDIIKFDRSLTIMAGMDENSKHMVEGFSNIFDKSDYKILFEGIETEADENIGKEMNAKYLQGYRYSKPIPIENLNDFLECYE